MKKPNSPETTDIQPLAGTETIAEPLKEPPPEETFAKFAKANGLADPQELEGFKAQIRGNSPSNSSNAMRGWIVGWGFLAALRGEFAHFPHDPEYRQGYELGTKYVNSAK